MAYAIIRAGGHQEKVEPGEIITVDRVKQEPGDQVNFTPMAISTGDKLIADKPGLEGASVVAKVLEHIKADKVESFQYRHKTGYRKHTGHRQPMSVLEVLEIQVGGQTFSAPEPAAAPESSAKESTPAKSASTTKKPAAKKPASKKPASSKK